MNSSVSVAIAAVSVFVLSSVWYTALTPVEVRVLGPAAPDQGGGPRGSRSCWSSCGAWWWAR